MNENNSTGDVNVNVNVNVICSTNKIENYMQKLYNKCSKYIPNIDKLEKINDYDVITPTMDTKELILQYNYNKEQLKRIVKHYKLRLSGNKKELITRIYGYLTLSKVIIKIQKNIRGFIYRNYIKVHGPAFVKRNLCVNDTDFLTMDELKMIPYTQFISFKDIDGFIYGFDIISLFNLVANSSIEVKNPYNRMVLPPDIHTKCLLLIKLSRLLKIDINVNINNEIDNTDQKKVIELRILTLFQNINALGNYSDHTWFLSLNRTALLRLVRELIEIWEYRAQLTIQVKREICPPFGNPFRNINMLHITNEQNIDKIRKYIVELLEKFVNTGINIDSRILGAYYVLAALTLVNSDAATVLEWHYQSVSYI